MNDLASGVVRTAVESLGISSEHTVGEEIWALCPMHKARTGKSDHHPSWSISERTGLHYCFSCHYKGNLFGLVKDLGGDVSALPGSERDRSVPVHEWWSGLATVEDMPSGPPVPDRPKFNPSSMALFVAPPDHALAARRLKRWAVDHYGVRWNPGSMRWILPLHDPDTSRIIGYQEKGPGYFRNVPSGMRKSETLFGYPSVGTSDRIAVVESPLDAVRLSGLGYPAVALCGSLPSLSQMHLLSAFPFVLWALDNDAAGRRGAEEGIRQAWFMSSRVEYGERDGKDVGEMEDDRIEEIFERAGF